MIPVIRIQGGRIVIPPIRQITGANIINDIEVSTIREVDIPKSFLSAPSILPPSAPVTIDVGKPIVDMPGCVKVHKENLKQRSKNKMLVDDDPKGNTVLCDNGMPYYDPPEYQHSQLSWTTVTPKEPEAKATEDDTSPPPTPPLGANTPDVPNTKKEEECPSPTDLRVGDFTTSKNEKVVGHEWNNDKTVCITLYEDVTWVDKYLPSPAVVTTTAGIALVATSSALLAKPLADLLLKVVKPVVKKVVAKVKTAIGKTPYRPTASEIKTNLYREKKGLLPKNFEKMRSQKK